MGYPTETPPGTVNSQLMTCAADGQILIWDTRSKSAPNKKNEKPEVTPMNVPETFKHLTSWKPLLKVSLPSSEPEGDFAPRKFSIAEREGDKTASKLRIYDILTPKLNLFLLDFYLMISLFADSICSFIFQF